MLAERPQIVVGNKCDLATEEQIETFRQYVAVSYTHLLANVLTRHDVGATLTNQDVAGQNELTAAQSI